MDLRCSEEHSGPEISSLRTRFISVHSLLAISYVNLSSVPSVPLKDQIFGRRSYFFTLVKSDCNPSPVSSAVMATDAEAQQYMAEQEA